MDALGAVVCRMAQRSDLAALLTLIPQIERDPLADGAQVPSLAHAEAIFDQLARHGNVFILVVTVADDMDLAATCTMTISPSLSHGGRPLATIETVVVATWRRGQGIGKQLLAYAFAHAREAGCYKVQLITRGRPDQIGFYRSAGFSWEGVGFKAYL
jgi:N-acetylglutamate synthase-like GNAT family acetyltransferase